IEYPDYKDKIGKPLYPEIIKKGRYTRGISEFTVNLNPDNVGVLLRRILDYSFPNQTAEVFITEVNQNSVSEDVVWEKAGTWYLAGATTHLFSWPRFGEDGERASGELAKRVYD